jgi:hypothetical protein
MDAVILAIMFFGSWFVFIQLASRVGFDSWIERVLPRVVASLVTALTPLGLAAGATVLAFIALGERLLAN